jgi:hypothetical protein
LHECRGSERPGERSKSVVPISSLNS